MNRVIASQKLLASAFLAAFYGGACSPKPVPDDPASPSMVKVDVLLTRSDVQIVRLEATATIANPAAHNGDELRWEVRNPDDGLVAEGVTADPRVVRAEFDVNGQPAINNHDFGGYVGTFSVNIPAVSGALVVLEPNGGGWQEIGRTNLSKASSDGLGSSEQALLDPATDVIGEPVAVVSHGDASKRANILIVSEGYTEAELGTFHADVDNAIAKLKLVSGFKEYWAGFNIWRQDIRSKQTGIADWETGTNPDTAFGVMRGSNKAGAPWPRQCIVYGPNVHANAFAVLAMLKTKVSADQVLILVNDKEYGGCAMPWLKTAFVTTNEHAPRVLAHEFGHSIFNLEDEYAGDCSTKGLGLNVSDDLNALPWSDLVNTNEIPTSDSADVSTVGAFIGAGYCDEGVYRPQHNCLMRELEAKICQVCAREMFRYFQNRGFVDSPITLQSCHARCCDETVIGGDEVDSATCLTFGKAQCKSYGGTRRVLYDGQLVPDPMSVACAPQPLPGSGPIQAQSNVEIGSTLQSGMWRNNEGWVRITPASDTTPGPAIGWQGPLPITLLAGQGNMQAQSDFVVGTTLKQGYWRGNEGWTRDVPIVNGTLGEATAWAGPIPLALLPGQGDMQAAGGIVIGETFYQWHWRNNEGWGRTAPVVNGTLGSASAWVPVSGAILPGSGEVQAWSDLLIDNKTTLLQGLWRENQAWVRTIPIVNGGLGTGTAWVYAGGL